jgi:hypothetical protein
MGPPRYRRKAVVDLEYFIPKYFPNNNHIVHDGSLSLPKYVKDIQWHAIILGSTFLCKCTHPDEFEMTLNDYGWIKDSNAVKIALPQDDYNCSEILDSWMVDWNINLIYSVLSENLDVLYPNYLNKGEIRLGYTGYISDDWLKKWKNPKSYDDRTIDVSYRASNLPANFGSLGYLKGQIGHLFVKEVKGQNLILDISTDPNDMIPGNEWHAFLENSKFCLTTASGSSLLDPKGIYRIRVETHTMQNPSADFEEIAEACFPGQDCKYTFTAISPRNIEAALLETVQIATPGTYSGIMEPYVDYIPLAEDCSNIEEVLTMMKDKKLVRNIAKNCKKKIIETPRLYLQSLANEIMNYINNNISDKIVINNIQKDNNKYFKKYNRYITINEKYYWLSRYLFYWFKDRINLLIK